MKINNIMKKTALAILISTASYNVGAKTAKIASSDIVAFSKPLNEIVENKNVSSNLDNAFQITKIKQGPRNKGVSGGRKTEKGFMGKVLDVVTLKFIFSPHKDGGSASCNRMIRNSRENNKCNTSKKIDRKSHNKRHKTVKTKRAETPEVAQKSEYCRSTRNPDVVYKVK
jgi:hypothetical protein